jgi:hypothetical protein
MVRRRKSLLYLAKTVLNGVGTQIKRPRKLSTIPDEGGGDQTSIAQQDTWTLLKVNWEVCAFLNFALIFPKARLS